MMSRAQALVVRKNKVLMVKHCEGNNSYWCLPGGGINKDEDPSVACLRELKEECNLTGAIIRKTSEINFGINESHFTFLIDIDNQEPTLGFDPELINSKQILQDVRWLELNEIPERDRAFLWSAGLLSIQQFIGIIEIWGNEISIPNLRSTT
jgi:8-oxo-dGTP diphosphatase